ncbi:MAG TPA: hypothetical protein VNX18_06395 [Bryobacteraceae bacterium]|nr:hypothetical protein [Bryobacteraceae bacterium]
MRRLVKPPTILASICFASCLASRAQSVKDQLPPELPVPRETGDSVQPVFDGWQRNADGTISMWFGYLNRNRKEVVDVPIGPANNFNIAVDSGQPTHFYTRRHQYAFKVVLPKDWDKDKKVIWTVTAHGEPCTATGWLQPEWETDDGVRQMNAGGGGLAPPADPPNTAPTITNGSPDQAAEVGKPIKLTASATDDGIPITRGRGGRGGLSFKWIQYRGPGQVTLDPESTPVAGKIAESSTTATFSAPGVYWIQAVASDGLLEAVHTIKVTVK